MARAYYSRFVSRADVERFDRDMMRGRTVSDDLERPDRQFRYIRIQMEQVEELRDSGRNPAGLADSLGFVAEALGELGWHDLARLVYLEKLDVVRGLPGEPDRKLDRVLTALRETLMKLERYEEALPVNYELWQLSAQHEDSKSRDSANEAKYSQVVILTKLGRHGEAAEAAEQAVAQIRQQLAKTNGQALAYALEEYADRLARVERYEEALAATVEAVGLWRSVGDKNPIRLAVAVDRAGQRLARLGRFEQAHAAYAEMVAILRRTVGTDRHSRKTLAGALNNFGDRLNDLGRYHEALTAAEESVRRYRALAADEQEDLRRWLAEPNDAPDDLARLEVARRRSGARKVELELCVALVNLSNWLSRAGRKEEALEINAEAIAVERRHRAAEPEATEPQLVAALNNQSILLGDLARYQESLAAAEEAGALARKLAVPEYVAITDNTLGVVLSKLGRHEEALAASLTAVAAYRALHATEPAEYEDLLAAALREQALVRSRRGEYVEASAAAAEAARRYRDLAEQRPDRYAEEYSLAQAVSAEIRDAAV